MMTCFRPHWTADVIELLILGIWRARSIGVAAVTACLAYGMTKSCPPRTPHTLFKGRKLLWIPIDTSRHPIHRTERGRAGLQANRYALCRLLWQLWSPNWQFDEATYARSARSFDNPDFVEVVIQSYRHRFGYAAGDPALETIEQRLAKQPTIGVPTIVLHGEGNGVSLPHTICYPHISRLCSTIIVK